MSNIRDSLINIILKVAMQHHDDISKQDEDAACDAADDILTKHWYLGTNLTPKNVDGLCYYCHEMTDILSRNPSKHPVMLSHGGELSITQYHHGGCVVQRLHSNEENIKLLTWCRKQFNKIKLCHIDCDVPDSEHDMFKLADEGNKKLCDKGVG